MTPAVIVAMAAQSRPVSWLPRKPTLPISVSGSSRMTISWTAASCPVPSAAAASTNEASMSATAPSQARRCSRSAKSLSRKARFAGASRLALRFSTSPTAFTEAARKAST